MFGFGSARGHGGHRRWAAALAALTALTLGATTAPAEADRARGHKPTSATGWYLALGDSVAAGYQPGLGDNPTGGYVGAVLGNVQQQTPKTHLRNLACSGESTTTMIAGGICSYDEGSQLAQALVFLHAHARATRLVTLTIGANDVTPCLQAGEPADIAACATTRLTAFQEHLAGILAQLHATAPATRIVVTNYYNPFLAFYFTAPALVPLTASLQAMLNGLIAAATAAPPGQPGDVADVASAFHSDDPTPVPPSNVPLNVVTVCQWTWMCAKGDIHPNDAGYGVIAQAVEKVL